MTRDGMSWLGKFVVGYGSYCLARQAVRHMRRFELAGRLVLITGGSRGMGVLLAREFGRAGARVAICARDADELEQARQKLRRQSVADVWTGVCDVTQEQDVA